MVIIHHLQRLRLPYSDLAADYLDQLDRARPQRHHVRRLQQLGYEVTLAERAAA